MSHRFLAWGSAAPSLGYSCLFLISLLILPVSCGGGEDPVEPAAVAESGSAAAPSVDLEITDADLTELVEGTPRVLAEAGIPGLSIAVYRTGRPVWAQAFGVVNADGSDEVRDDTVFEAASLSKPVFAYAVMRLVERGMLDLDVPLADIYPYDRLEHEPRYRQITPRMVMSHSTGLPNWGGDRLELAFDPGTEFSYSGEGFVFLQRAVEKITGMDLNGLMLEEVFEPLGMSHSSYVWLDEYDDLSATGHDALGRPQQKGKPSRPNAAATLHTTAGDYAKFLGALIEERGLEHDTFEMIFSPQVSVPGDDDEFEGTIFWGLGWGLQVGHAETSFWHWGDNGPFKAYVVGYREAGVGLVYFANSDAGLTIGEAVLSNVLEDRYASFDMLDYGRFDSPDRVAQMALHRAFVHDGRDAGQRALEELRRNSPEIATQEFVNSLGYFLMGEREFEAAVGALELNRHDYPDSANAHDSLGEAYLQADRMEQAIESYQRAQELDPENEAAEANIVWARQSIEARQNPIEIPAETLTTYAGQYGPRRVSYEQGTLYYQREENPRYRLYAITSDIFGLDGLGYFRVRFAAAEGGQIDRLVGLLVSGSEDVSERSR
jgi:CubicO group peptidase (beta-lactamase class C family)